MGPQAAYRASLHHFSKKAVKWLPRPIQTDFIQTSNSNYPKIYHQSLISQKAISSISYLLSNLLPECRGPIYRARRPLAPLSGDALPHRARRPLTQMSGKGLQYHAHRPLRTSIQRQHISSRSLIANYSQMLFLT